MERTRRIAQLTICLWLLLLLTASLAWATPTTSEQARQVVANWILLKRQPLGAPLSQQVKNIQTFADASGPLYFVVYLEPVGLVFVPADDLVEPIIGFAPEMKDYDPSLDNPLGALVSQDMPGRVLQARYLERAANTLGGSSSPPAGSSNPRPNGRLWRRANSRPPWPPREWEAWRIIACPMPKSTICGSPLSWGRSVGPGHGKRSSLLKLSARPPPRSGHEPS